MTHCTRCGANNRDVARFCHSCGNELSGAGAAVAVASREEARRCPRCRLYSPACARECDCGFSFDSPLLTAEVRYAEFWRRAAALVVDSVVLYGATFSVSFLAGFILAASGNRNDVLANLVGGVAGLIVGLLYYPLMESSQRRATLGKQVLGIQVTDSDGGQIGVGRAFGRYLAKIASLIVTLGIGILMAGFTQKKQALHDKIAGTLVVVRAPEA